MFVTCHISALNKLHLLFCFCFFFFKKKRENTFPVKLSVIDLGSLIFKDFFSAECFAGIFVSLSDML